MICAGHQPGLALISTQHTPRPSSAATAGAAAGAASFLAAFALGPCTAAADAVVATTVCGTPAAAAAWACRCNPAAAWTTACAATPAAPSPAASALTAACAACCCTMAAVASPGKSGEG